MLFWNCASFINTAIVRRKNEWGAKWAHLEVLVQARKYYTVGIKSRLCITAVFVGLGTSHECKSRGYQASDGVNRRGRVVVNIRRPGVRVSFRINHCVKFWTLRMLLFYPKIICHLFWLFLSIRLFGWIRLSVEGPYALLFSQGSQQWITRIHLNLSLGKIMRSTKFKVVRTFLAADWGRVGPVRSVKMWVAVFWRMLSLGLPHQSYLSLFCGFKAGALNRSFLGLHFFRRTKIVI